MLAVRIFEKLRLLVCACVPACIQKPFVPSTMPDKHSLDAIPEASAIAHAVAHPRRACELLVCRRLCDVVLFPTCLHRAHA